MTTIMALRRAVLGMTAAAAWAACSMPAHAASDLAVSDTTAMATRKAGEMFFNLKRSGDLSTTVTARYATADGTAVAGRDYTATSGSFTIPPGATLAEISVPIAARAPRSGRDAKTFTLTLSNATVAGGSAPFYNQSPALALSGFVESAAVADFDGDGKPDLAFANSSGSVQWLRNTTAAGAAAASFAPAGSIDGLNGPWDVRAADLNRDGKPDLVVSLLNTNAFVVLINTTPAGAQTPTFKATTITAPSAGFSSAAVADFDGDGIPDIALIQPGSSSSPGTNRLLVYRNTTPKGAQAPALQLALSTQCSVDATSFCNAVRVFDVNGDGKPDIAVGSLVSADVSVFVNTTPAGGAIAYAPVQSFNLGTGVSNIAAGDLDGDGRTDLAVTQNGVNGTGTQWSTLINRTPKGSATVAFDVTTLGNGAPYGITIADANGDGRPDVVMTNMNGDGNGAGTIDVFVNGTTPGGPLVLVKSTSVAFGDEPHALAVLDFNADGRTDLFTVDPQAKVAAVFLGTSATTSSVRVARPTGTATITGRARGGS